LKLYAQTFLDAPEVGPLAQAAVDMGVPILSHVAQRPGAERRADKPRESGSDDVHGLVERFPELAIISGHIGGGGLWEYRVKNLRDLENVQSHYVYIEQLPVSESERDRVRSEDVLSLLE
jgi:predicted TIM-barrel fold metal-dependent hydrolase